MRIIYAKNPSPTGGLISMERESLTPVRFFQAIACGLHQGEVTLPRE